MDEAEQDRVLAALRSEPTEAARSSTDRAILDYAMKLTVNPASITTGDVQTLRAHGLDDRAIHDVCAITAYFAFVNRIADGLGVELEQSG